MLMIIMAGMAQVTLLNQRTPRKPMNRSNSLMRPEGQTGRARARATEMATTEETTGRK